MTAGKYDLEIAQGADFNIQLTWKDDNDVLIDLTGYSARMKLKNKIGGTIEIDCGSYITLGGVNGTIDIDIPASITETITFEQGVYDLELVSSGGNVYRIMQGKANVSFEVTD